MLPVNETPKTQAASHDFVAGLLALFALLGIAAIEQDQGMQVAVSGVEDVTDDQPILLANALDFRERSRNFGARDNAVLRVVSRGYAAHGAEGGLAAEPEQLALLFVGGPAPLAGFLLQANRAARLRLLVHLFLESLEFDQQHRRRVFGIAGMDVVFNASHHPPIQHLERRRS